MPIGRVVEIGKFCERSERTFSAGASYLIKMGLLYVNDVLPDQEKYVDSVVEERLKQRRTP